MFKTINILLVAAFFALIWATHPGPASGQGLSLPPPPVPAKPGKDSSQTKKPPFATEMPEVSISARAASPSVARDDIFNFIITIQYRTPADQELLPMDFEFPNPPAAPGLTLIGNSFRSTSVLAGSTLEVIRTYTYDFSADIEGATEVGPVRIRYRAVNGDKELELSTQPVPVTVIAPPIRPGRILRHPASLALIAAALALAVAGLVYSSSKSRRAAAAKAEPEISPLDLAKTRIDRAERNRLAGDYPGYFEEMLEAVYITLEEAGVRARGRGPSELENSIGDKLDHGLARRVADLVRLSDKVKFAGYSPGSSEMDAAMAVSADLLSAVEDLLGEAAPKRQESGR